MKHRIIAILIGVLIVAAVVGGMVYWEWGAGPKPILGPPPAAAKPKISWTPASVTEIVGQGQSKTVQVSFTASENVSNVIVRVVPELQPFVQINPVAFASVAKDQNVNLNLTISAAATAPFGTFRGTIQLRSGSDPKKTFARPLLVTVEVGRVFGDPSGVRFTYPTFGQPSDLQIRPSGDGVVTIDIRLKSAFTNEMLSQFNLSIIPNDEGLGLSQWFTQHVDPSGILLAAGTFRQESLINGMDALIFVGPTPQQYSEQFGPVSAIYAVSPSHKTIVSGSLSQVHELDLYGYTTPDDQLLLLRAVFESFVFP